MSEKTAVYLTDEEIRDLACALYGLIKYRGLDEKFSVLLFQRDRELCGNLHARGYVRGVGTVQATALERTVHEALDAAYGEEKDPLEAMAARECDSLVSYCAELEDRDPRELLEHVQSWVGKKRSER